MVASIEQHRYLTHSLVNFSIISTLTLKCAGRRVIFAVSTVPHIGQRAFSSSSRWIASNSSPLSCFCHAQLYLSRIISIKSKYSTVSQRKPSPPSSSSSFDQTLFDESEAAQSTSAPKPCRFPILLCHGLYGFDKFGLIAFRLFINYRHHPRFRSNTSTSNRLLEKNHVQSPFSWLYRIRRTCAACGKH